MKAPFLTTSFSENGKKAKIRFENILNGNKKRGAFVLIFALVLTVAAGGLASCQESESESTAIIGGADGPTAASIGFIESDEIMKAILNVNERMYLSEYDETEFSSAGYVILGEEKNNSERKIYALVTYGEYQFLNGNFVKNAGSGTIPTVIVLDKDNDVVSYQEPQGKADRETVEKMFPKEYADRVFDKEQRKLDYEACKKMEEARAKEYLKLIGRENTKVGAYGDFDYKFIEDADMDVSASNSLFLEYRDYPQYIGTIERVEEGTRYVYEKKWNSKKQEITYIKYVYDTGEIVEETVICVKDGEVEMMINKL